MDYVLLEDATTEQLEKALKPWAGLNNGMGPLVPEYFSEVLASHGITDGYITQKELPKSDGEHNLWHVAARPFPIR